ncbi:hypothetical protein M0R04_08380 [Candidatus Dojkabacteria bacterium]|jgi:hypothetical protein|nr:hypothetical protein [Candidatus Dojkabacteria bacterium]
MKKDTQPNYMVNLKKPIVIPAKNEQEAKEQVIDDMRSGLIGTEDLKAEKEQ